MGGYKYTASSKKYIVSPHVHCGGRVGGGWGAKSLSRPGPNRTSFFRGFFLQWLGFCTTIHISHLHIWVGTVADAYPAVSLDRPEHGREKKKQVNGASQPTTLCGHSKRGGVEKSRKMGEITSCK